jgi:diaminopimelate epimerase
MRATIEGAIEFAKLSGSGNDFICIDNRGGRFNELLKSGRVAQLARSLCPRGVSVGADGVIFCGRVAGNGQGVDTEARFFEPDGSEAELCGNGAACFTYWVITNKWLPGPEIKILTSAGVVTAKRVEGDYVRVCIPLPRDRRTDIEITVKGRPWKLDCMITGVPHVIAYVEDVNRVDVAHWGPGIRYHEYFQPRGANANFVQILGEGRIAMRTHEFGVENETLACGTGAAAAAISAAIRYKWQKQLAGDEPVLVRARSGDFLKIWFTQRTDGAIVDVCLETLVRFVFDGVLRPEVVSF